MLTRSARAARRLASAMRRHGPRRVAEFGVGVLRRHGVAGALRYALMRGEPPKAAAGGDPAAGRDLDERFTLAEAAWRSWLARWEGQADLRRTAAEDRPRPVKLAYVVEAPPGPGFEAACASIRAVRPTGAEGDAPLVLRAGEAPAAAPEDGYVVFLQAGDRVEPGLGAAIADAARRGRVEMVSFDLVHRAGGRVAPLFLPGPNPTLARAAPGLYARFAMAASALPAAAARGGAQAVLSAWLESRPPALARARWRHAGGVPLVEIATPLPPPPPRPPALRPVARDVSVVICTKDKGHLTRQLVRGLLDTQPQVLEVVIVSNATTRPHALETLHDLDQDPRVRVIRRDEPFNFSRLANAGARIARGGTLLFLNDDIVAVTGDWLARLGAHLEAPGVGAVGPLLVYPDERVQHAGMHLGFHRSAGHTLRRARLPQDEYAFLASAAREVSCVTGAVLLTPRPVFEALNGFDERLAVMFQDVDYCMRARRGGFVSIFEPAAVLIHMESVSVGEAPAEAMNLQRGREHAYFLQRWGEALGHDPCFPAGLDPDDETLHSLRWPQ